jgi:hypothetical protein
MFYVQYIFCCMSYGFNDIKKKYLNTQRKKKKERRDVKLTIHEWLRIC